MPILSQNPANKQILGSFELLTNDEVASKIQLSKKTFSKWKETNLSERADLMRKLALVLRENREEFATLITQEMGCPISQSASEIEKSAYIADYFADNIEKFLNPESVELDAKEAYVRFDPLGTILHVAPWNYPFYLALRPVIPAILAGNTVVMKHASNVPQCSLALHGIFQRAGFPEGVFQSLLVSSSQIEGIIKSPEIAMVTLIGSEKAGSSVASIAGREIKKTILELGGNDPFIVLADADLEKAVSQASQSRLRGNGQSCNAAKRYIVAEEVADKFIELLKIEFAKFNPGDPMDSNTTLGPVATAGAFADLKRQFDTSIEMGAKVAYGGEFSDEKGYFISPTILTNITKEMPVYKEEVFGPIVPVIVVQSVEEAISVANDSELGLGASLWTQDYELAKSLIPKLDCGNVYINSMVRGEPKLPYGGIKKSGYGREFGEYGIKEFVNIKSVVIR